VIRDTKSKIKSPQLVWGGFILSLVSVRKFICDTKNLILNKNHLALKVQDG
jgi:hypothetical protein